MWRRCLGTECFLYMSPCNLVCHFLVKYGSNSKPVMSFAYVTTHGLWFGANFAINSWIYVLLQCNSQRLLYIAFTLEASFLCNILLLLFWFTRGHMHYASSACLLLEVLIIIYICLLGHAKNSSINRILLKKRLASLPRKMHENIHCKPPCMGMRSITNFWTGFRLLLGRIETPLFNRKPGDLCSRWRFSTALRRWTGTEN